MLVLVMKYMAEAKLRTNKPKWLSMALFILTKFLRNWSIVHVWSQRRKVKRLQQFFSTCRRKTCKNLQHGVTDVVWMVAKKRPCRTLVQWHKNMWRSWKPCGL